MSSHIKMTKSENSITTGEFFQKKKTSLKATKTTNTSMNDNSFRIIILNRLDEYTKKVLLNNCPNFSEAGPFRLFEIEMKIKKNKSFPIFFLEELNRVGMALYQYEDQINRVRNGKLPYNFNKRNKFQRNTAKLP
ncbi:hypothetical protein H8356DRAFT_1428429 [Neocallimastix lanati (nom. inval.)]|nr:hypothetical protein H8356DRAFT_1428429 [Neocallimastix sp. JGI-2020a]